MRTFTIKIKTAAGTRYQDGIFASKWAAIEAGIAMLGTAEGNVSAQVVPC